MDTVKKVELLAPAGCREGFYGAIHAGADAVYLGGSRFGARAYADNFSEEELLECIRYAHLWGRRVYLTVNTLVKESEFPELEGYLAPYYQAGLDGVIIQDAGVLAFIREHFPGLELHVSTQMTITGSNGALLLKEMGACRIVPARELSLKELMLLKKESGLEIEAFIHGAMCYCYSGQCLFSSILGGRSGNRGRCAQPCRLPYKAETAGHKTDACYPLSLKDMCTIEHIPELIEAGIDSFKIEGRMKKPEYAAGVTAFYRKYIDSYYRLREEYGARAGEYFHVEKKDLEALSVLYIRSERQNGYFYQQNGRDMVTLKNPAYSGTDEKQLAWLRRTYIEEPPRMPIAVYSRFLTGREAEVTLVLEELSVTAKGQLVQPAQNRPITEENLRSQLGRLGESVFCLSHMELELSDDAFYPLRQINELRREAVRLLEEALLEKNGYIQGCRAETARAASRGKNFLEKKSMEENFLEKDALKEVVKKASSRVQGQWSLPAVSVRTLQQLEALAALDFPISRLYVEGDLLAASSQDNAVSAKDRQEIFSFCVKAAEKCKVLLTLPYILRSYDAVYLEDLYGLVMGNREIFSGFLVRSLEGLGFLKKKSFSGAVYSDAGVYIWNRAAFQELFKQGGLSGFCLPYELNAGEQRLLAGAFCEKPVYGRIPMMITANCVAKTTCGCQKNGKIRLTELTDRYGAKFPAVLCCSHCMNIIYNSVPLSLHEEAAAWKSPCIPRLNFTLESREETAAIMEYFLALLKSGRAEKPPYGAYTAGHEKRGVL